MGLTSSREPAQPTTPIIPHHIDDLASVLSTTTTTTATSPTKGGIHWKPQQQNHHVRQASVRSRAAQPMPDHNELDTRFAKVLVSFISISFLSLFVFSRYNSNR